MVNRLSLQLLTVTVLVVTVNDLLIMMESRAIHPFLFFSTQYNPGLVIFKVGDVSPLDHRNLSVLCWEELLKTSGFF
jgi:hypothetical protein